LQIEELVEWILKHSVVPKIDLHIHSEFSPCSRGTTVQEIASVAEAKGLEKIAITDHARVKRPSWLSAYFSEIERARGRTHIDILTGVETNIHADGTLAVDKDILGNLDIVIGALHTLPILEMLRKRSILEEYVTVLLKSLEVANFQILAHPTNILWNKRIPSEAAELIIRKLKEKNVAVEMNYHHKDPSSEFLRSCIEAGVTITPSSDAHQLKEIGHFEWFDQQIAGIKETVSWIKI